MEKFRVISDLHLDINEHYPLEFNDDIFTVICGDTSGSPSMSIDWIKKNIKCGVGVSGNHLPYNDDGKTIQELREELANAFPNNAAFTYLDCETGVFSKEVDGILFIGTCMYTDMHVKHEQWNPDGDIGINMRSSEYNMNDFRWGIKSKIYPVGQDNSCTTKSITAHDYIDWFSNAYNKIEAMLNKNEALANPKPIVLITHHPLIVEPAYHNWYMENPNNIYSMREYNLASYVSDMRSWLVRHNSIKCYCYGHIHAIEEDWRNFNIMHADGSKMLVINNARGYVMRGHDSKFMKNVFVNTTTWEVEKSIDKDEESAKEERNKSFEKNLAWLI